MVESETSARASAWDINRHLPSFESAVLTGLDEEGYPYSVRCRSRPDPATRTLSARLPASVSLMPGPASLLCHRHDENLWNLKSFLARGVLAHDAENYWVFRPERFIPGAGIGGPMSMVRFILASRRSAKSYLEKRGLTRPRIPWEEIEEIKAQARTSESQTYSD